MRNQLEPRVIVLFTAWIIAKSSSLAHGWFFQSYLQLQPAAISLARPTTTTRLVRSPPSSPGFSLSLLRQRGFSSTLSSLRMATTTEMTSNSVPSLSPKSILKDEYDHIIIGSGIGGLSVASLLAQSSKKKDPCSILLLEQHDVIGGCTHTFSRRGYSFGVGIHYVGEMAPDGRSNPSGLHVKHLLDAVTPKDDPIVWDRMPDTFDSVLLGVDALRRYDMVANQQAQVLKQVFPNQDDQTAIDSYFKMVEKAVKSIKFAVIFKRMPRRLTQFVVRKGWYQWLDGGYHKFATSTVQEVVQSLTNNEELQRVLTYSWGDYGATPSQAPFFMHALLTAHYSMGAYYPQGGPKRIAQHILKVLQERNCDVRVKSPVERIVVENGRAAGVQLLSDNGRIIRARKSIVSDAGYYSTCYRLLPKEYQPPTTINNSNLRNGPCGLSLFVGLRGDHDMDYHLPTQNLWIYPDDVPMAQCVDAYPSSLDEVMSHRFAPVFVGSPSGKDSSWKFHHPGRSTLEILTAVPWEWFESYAPISNNTSAGQLDPGGRPGSHGGAYESMKRRLAQLLWTRARQGLLTMGASSNIPELLDNVDYYELGTPVTFAHYLWADKGAFYGLDHTTTRFDPQHFYLTLRPEVPNVKGLYLTGQDIASCGLAGALGGGYLCASTILGVAHPFWMLGRVKRHRVVANDSNESNQGGIRTRLRSFRNRVRPRLTVE